MTTWWRRPAWKAALAAALIAASLSFSAPPMLPSWCSAGAAHLVLSPRTARPGELVSVIGAGIGPRPRQYVYDQLYTVRNEYFTAWWELGLLGPGSGNRVNVIPGGMLPAGGLPNRLFHFRVPPTAPGDYVVASHFVSAQQEQFLCASLRITSARR